jgi:hypothetical protein
LASFHKPFFFYPPTLALIYPVSHLPSGPTFSHLHSSPFTPDSNCTRLSLTLSHYSAAVHFSRLCSASPSLSIGQRFVAVPLCTRISKPTGTGSAPRARAAAASESEFESDPTKEGCACASVAGRTPVREPALAFVPRRADAPRRRGVFRPGALRPGGGITDEKEDHKGELSQE